MQIKPLDRHWDTWGETTWHTRTWGVVTTFLGSGLWSHSNCHMEWYIQRYPLVNVYRKLWKDPPFFMGKSTISMVIFNSKLLNYQRVIYFLVQYFSMIITRGYSRLCFFQISRSRQNCLYCFTSPNFLWRSWENPFQWFVSHITYIYPWKRFRKIRHTHTHHFLLVTYLPWIPSDLWTVQSQWSPKKVPKTYVPQQL